MQRVMWKSEIHRAAVARADLHSEGSLTIVPELEDHRPAFTSGDEGDRIARDRLRAQSH